MNIFKNKNENNIFLCAILASMVLHTIFFIASGMFLVKDTYKPPPYPEVSYVRIKPTQERHIAQTIRTLKDETDRLRSQDLIPLPMPLPIPKKIDSFVLPTKEDLLGKDILRSMTEIQKPEVFSTMQWETSIPFDVDEPADGKEFSEYFSVLMSKIRQELNAYPKHLIKDEGIVKISFKLLRNGSLMDVSVISSSGIGLLDTIATGAVKRASPFPVFPQDIDKQQAVFRVSISFEKK